MVLTSRYLGDPSEAHYWGWDAATLDAAVSQLTVAITTEAAHGFIPQQNTAVTLTAGNRQSTCDVLDMDRDRDRV